jgi:hypothetical protein
MVAGVSLGGFGKDDRQSWLEKMAMPAVTKVFEGQEEDDMMWAQDAWDADAMDTTHVEEGDIAAQLLSLETALAKAKVRVHTMLDSVLCESVQLNDHVLNVEFGPALLISQSEPFRYTIIRFCYVYVCVLLHIGLHINDCSKCC